MVIEKKHLAQIKRCYCASAIAIEDETHLFFASEDPNIGCYEFSGEKYDQKDTVWEAPGGCMSIIPIPNRSGEFLAVQEFYLKVSPSASKLVWCKKDETGKWISKDVLHMPYLHRFDIYNQDGVNYFVGATIATSKEDKEDWRVPGRIYVGVLPEEPSEGIKLDILSDGLFRNHGYWKSEEGGVPIGYFGSDQGILKVTPPRCKSGQWETECILTGNISEIAAIDIDQDGEVEFMTIEAFHGNRINIYKKIEGKYEIVYTYANEIDFAHTLVACNLRGVPTFLAGVRRVDAEIFSVQYIGGNFVTTTIDTGVGPANLCVVNKNKYDLIVAANHTANEAALYYVCD